MAEFAAQRYAQVGVSTVELRPSPFGGSGETRRKIREVLVALATFADEGLTAVLGQQGLLGPTALSLGLASSFSVGVGYREHYDYSRMISTQKKGGSNRGGPTVGVFIPAANQTLPSRVAQTLYQEPELRTRLRCSLGDCAERIDGPVADPRGHYLHARAHSVNKILDQPERWRPNLLRDELVKARDERDRINAHLPRSATALDNTTLRHLKSEIDSALGQVA